MGYDFITGPELIEKFKDQFLRSHYVDHRIVEAEAVERGDGGFRVTLSDHTAYRADSLIVATGMSRRALGVPGEEEFQRKGVFYSNDMQIRENVAVLRFTGGEALERVVFRPISSAEEESVPVSAGRLTRSWAPPPSRRRFRLLPRLPAAPGA